MKILITGGTGYIGSNLAKNLMADNDVSVLSISKPLITMPAEINIFTGNINDKNLLDKALLDVEIVFHLAASVPFGKDFTPESSAQDIANTISLLEEFRRKGGKKFIFLSGHVVYSEKNKVPISENSVLDPMGYYGVSKLACENYIKIFCSQNKMDFLILRAASIYGPGQRSSGVIPNFIKAALSKTSIEAPLNVKRDYLFIEDAVSVMRNGMIMGTGIYNIGSGKSVLITDIAKIISKLSGHNYRIKGILPKQNEILDNELDVSKAKEELGMRINCDLQVGLKKVLEYERTHGSIF